MKVHFNQISLKKLSALEDADKNTVTICCQNGLLDLGKIIQYEEIDSNNSIINRIDSFSVNQKALFNCIVRYRFSTLSVSSSDAIKSYIKSDIGIQGVKYILSDSHGEIKNIRDFGINTICEINDFVNSFNEIIDKVYNYSPIDGICVEFFKKAKLFDVCIEHLKKS